MSMSVDIWGIFGRQQKKNQKMKTRETFVDVYFDFDVDLRNCFDDVLRLGLLRDRKFLSRASRKWSEMILPDRVESSAESFWDVY